jgi:copper homeostasis protein
MDFKLEVIAFNLACCTKIQEAGAHRIELCANPYEGGTTPAPGFIRMARKNVSVALFPIIRPRGGDFFYNAAEFEIMKEDVLFCKQSGCDGIVTGLLNPDGTVDKKRCGLLVELAYPMSVTFHRAFDRTVDPFPALEDIIDTGFERILTSGLRPTALKGIQVIESLVKKADERIIIMPGSGIRSDNILELASRTGATEFHTSARISSASRMEYLNEEMDESLKTIEVDQQEVKQLVHLLSQKA